ncbi:Calcium channel yvc1 [Tilletia horrida]|nr:Calcium channel yvc1 [Tilletia horrida]
MSGAQLNPSSASRPAGAARNGSGSNVANSKNRKQPSAHELRSTYRDDPEHEAGSAEGTGAGAGAGRGHTSATMSVDPLGSGVSTRLLPRTDVSPKTISALIRRVRALVVQLIPTEIELETVTGTEGILTPEVIKTFDLAGGDFADAVPFCLIESYHEFLKDAERSDYDLNHLRATACEIAARRLVAHFESSAEADYLARHPNVRGRYEGSHVSLSKRFRKALPDGKIVRPRSALESAVEGGCQEFLTSPEAQRTVKAIWRGMIVQAYSDDNSGDIFLVRYSRRYSTKVIRHFDPSRLQVPLYQYILSVSIWVAFVVIFSIATWQFRPKVSLAELVMYGMFLGYLSDDVIRWSKAGLGQMTVWLGLDIFTDFFLAASLVIRIWSLSETDPQERLEMHKLSFRVLVSAAPFIWLQLLRIGDCTRFFGVIQVIVIRMLSESAAFFILLILVGFGAAQALWGLNLVDDKPISDAGSRLVELVLQGVLGAMSFGTISNGFSGVFGKVIAYVYYFILILILRSILVALFGTAFASVQRDANDIYQTFFATRVVDSIGVPDRHVFVAPFNLIEILVAAPISLLVPRKTYHKIVNVIQCFVFFVPLLCIALYESRVDRRAARAQRKVVNEPIAGDDREHAIQLGERGTVEDPAIPEDATTQELQISRVPFADLIKTFPAATQTEVKQHEVLLQRVVSTNDVVNQMLTELKALREEVTALKTGKAAKK